MRVAVVDIGTNSTRLLVADVDPSSGTVEQVVRRSQVTRLGHGVDASGELERASVERTWRVLEEYRDAIAEHRCEANMAVLTSAVRDAANGDEFAARVRDELGFDAKVLSGDEEAQLTFQGAMAGRPPADVPTVVIDIGGGSTEFVVGSGRSAAFHVSTPAGVVRMTERHIRSDPPAPEEVQALGEDTERVFREHVPEHERSSVRRGIAVAGTATSAASIELELEPYDPTRVHGHRLLLATVELLLARLAEMDEARRREVVGLHPDRAPTIVAGMVLLSRAMQVMGLEEVEVSEHDILYGGALRLAGCR